MNSIPQKLARRTLPKTPGVYIILNGVNHHMYVGSTVNLYTRYSQHVNELSRGKHHNEHLQRAYDRYGSDVFAFCVVDHLPDASKLVEREQLFMDLICPEYNMNPTAERNSPPSNIGRKHTPEHRANNAASRRASNAVKLQSNPDALKQEPEWITPRVEAARETNLGRKMTPDVKTRILTTRKVNNEAKREANPDAFKKSPEEIARSNATRAARRKADPTYGTTKGHVMSDKQKADLSSAHTGKKLSPASIAKREAAKRANRLAKQQELQPPLF